MRSLDDSDIAVGIGLPLLPDDGLVLAEVIVTHVGKIVDQIQVRV